MYAPFWHSLTRQFSTKQVKKNVDDLASFRDNYLNIPKEEKFKNDLHEISKNSKDCFYYKTNYDARLLWLRNPIENRGDFTDQSIRDDFMKVLASVDVAEVLNSVR